MTADPVSSPYGGAVSIRIVDEASFTAAMEQIASLVDRGEHHAAVGMAESATSGPGLSFLVAQLQAWAYTEGGGRLNDRELIVQGLGLWRSFGPLTNPDIAYNVANAEFALFNADLAASGYEAALLEHRDSLASARRLYDEVGRNSQARPDLRVQALTNSGNAYDTLGRDMEALRRYDGAIALDPEFGMALGNRAITYGHYARFHEHSGMLLALAARDLDAAMSDQARVIAIGGPPTMEHFKLERARIVVRGDLTISNDGPDQWRDPHARWCFEQELFLHFSHSCLRPEDTHHDALFVQGINSGSGDDERRRVLDLIDAFNTLVQDFVAARYLTWLAVAADSPVFDQARAISARVPFHDSMMCARWGARTAMALQALTAATNLLDKVAAFLHLYFRTGRRSRDVYFRGFWRAKPTKSDRRPAHMEPAFARLLPDATEPNKQHNLGLLALCDLSRDLDADTPLARLLALRHAVTHRFLVAHHGVAPESNAWLERLEWSELVDVMLEQLTVGRAALVYLVRAVDLNEEQTRMDDVRRDAKRGEIRLQTVDPRDAEID